MTQKEHVRAVRKLMPGHVVKDPNEFNDLVDALDDSEHCHLLCPTRYIDAVPDVSALSFRLVALKPEDFYEAYWSRGTLAPKKDALEKMLREAGGNFLPSKRLDDRTDPNYREIEGGVSVRQLNGNWAEFWKSKTVDFRPGAPDLNGMSDSQVTQMRRRIHEICETKAQARAMRSAFGMAQTYAAAEACKPFVCIAVVPMFERGNAIHEHVAVVNAVGGPRSVAALYGNQKGREQESLPPAELPSNVTPDGEYVDAVTVDDFDDEFPDPEPTTGPTCQCVCGCAKSINEDVQRITIDKIGRASCAECYLGGRSYDAKRHAQYTERQMAPKRAAS